MFFRVNNNYKIELAILYRYYTAKIRQINESTKLLGQKIGIESLFCINLLEQTVCLAPFLHHIEHIADIHTDATGQLGVEEDI